MKSYQFLRNRVYEHKMTADKITYDQMTNFLLDECLKYDLLLGEIRQVKGLNLPDKPNPGKAMLGVSGR